MCVLAEVTAIQPQEGKISLFSSNLQARLFWGREKRSAGRLAIVTGDSESKRANTLVVQ